MRDSALLPALLLVASVSQAQDNPAQRRGPEFGTFSNLKFNEDTSDVLGFEITIIPGFRTAYVIFQCAEGAPETPVFVPAQVSAHHIRFIVPVTDPSSCGGEFTATVGARGIRLKQANNPADFLPRRRSYWAR